MNNTSIIKNYLDNWYATNISGTDYEDYISDTLFCNDRQLGTEVGGSVGGPGYGWSETYYAGYYRLLLSDIPNVKCGLKNDRFTTDDTTIGNGALTYPIGLLTADEGAMAGLVDYISNNSNYLYNGQTISFLTPAYMYTDEDYDIAYNWYVLTSGAMDFELDVYGTDAGVRGVINLKPNTKIVGTGTTTNPYIVTEELPNTWETPKEGTLLKAIKDNNTVTAPITTPGRVMSTADEKVLASTPDDYGTSYYFRGAVDNNYVEFAGMCFRIVRVTGNNSIKLALYNNNESQAANPCRVSSSTAAFAVYTGTTYSSAFNSSSNQNAYIGFKYGTPGSASYDLEHANTNKSTILTNLESWYNLRLSSYTEYLADTIWCNDKSIDTVYLYGNSLGYAANQTGYSPRGRIYADGSYATAANPSLVCPNTGSDNKLSKFTVSDTINGNGNLTYKVGLLTADEIVFAGAIYSSDNSTYYLKQNATGTWWWSLSPYRFSGAYAYVWFVYSTGYLNFNYVVSNSGGLRPAVSIHSGVHVTGTGTTSDPYIVQI